MAPDLHDVRLSYVILSRNSSYLQWSFRQPQLSLFQQTLLENDEVFYKTFPAARLALQQNLSEPFWRPQFQVADFAGYGFQPDFLSPDHAPFARRVDGAQCTPHFYTLHNQMVCPCMPSSLAPEGLKSACQTPRMSPRQMHHESASDPAPSSLHITTSQPPDMPYLSQYPQSHQHSPVSDSLASPSSFSHLPYHTPVHFGASPPISPPSHSDFPPPLTPPALVPSSFSPVKTEPEQQFIIDQPYSSLLVPPARRGSLHQITSSRSQRRYSPLFNRTTHQTPKSGGSEGASPINVPVMEWTTTPSPTITVNTNVESSLANAANNTASPAAQSVATVATASVPPSSGTPEARPLLSEPVPGSSNTNTGGNSKRNPDKKPALACVFCRGRKIACGPPLKDGDGKSCKYVVSHREIYLCECLSIHLCSQCQRRSLRCEYPTESRRGMRKKPAANSTTSSASNSTKAKRNANVSSNSQSTTDLDSPKQVAKTKRR